MDKRYAEHFAWLKERMMKVKAKIVNSNGTSGIIPVQALPVDHKKKASGDDDDNELVRNEQGELVLKKYLGL